MPRFDYKRCRECGRLSSEVGTLSHTRLCLGCALRREQDNNWEIAEKRGPAYAHQLRRTLMAANKALVDLGRSTA